MMKTEDRARFAHIGAKGEKLLTARTVSIAGLGGMGTAVASMLARENIDLRIVDKGRIEEEDMHRLSLFHEEDITKFKVKQAKAHLASINPHAQVKSFHEEVDENNVFLLQGDAIIDATNSAQANSRIAKYALDKKIPLIIGRYAGSHVCVLVLQKKNLPKMLEKINLPSIETQGVFGPIGRFTGSLLCAQALKVLLGDKNSYLIEADLWTGTMKTTKL